MTNIEYIGIIIGSSMVVNEKEIMTIAKTDNYRLRHK